MERVNKKAERILGSLLEENYNSVPFLFLGEYLLPELPEVETVVRDLRPLLMGQSIGGVLAGKKKLRSGKIGRWILTLEGDQFSAVRRRGKWIILELASGRCLLVHLGMTGQLKVMNAREGVESHTHLRMELAGVEKELRYRDIRRFGWLELFASAEELASYFCSMKLGLEPWEASPEYFQEKLQNSQRPVKNLLLDQEILAGVGNIYADESLFESRLHPRKKGKSLSREDVEKLLKAVQRVLTRAISHRGSTLRNYVGGTGLKGGFQNEFQVYGREGEACPVCSKAVERIVLAGRSAHYCPICQPSPKGRS